MTDNKIVVDISSAFEALASNPNLARQMNTLILGGPIAEQLEQASDIVQIVMDYINKHEISCPESIYQRDKIWETAPELVEQLANIVGYWKDPDGEE